MIFNRSTISVRSAAWSGASTPTVTESGYEWFGSPPTSRQHSQDEAAVNSALREYLDWQANRRAAIKVQS